MKRLASHRIDVISFFPSLRHIITNKSVDKQCTVYCHVQIRLKDHYVKMKILYITVETHQRVLKWGFTKLKRRTKRENSFII